MGIWNINEKNIPIISLGMKGLLYVELIACGPNKDTHSSLAVIVENLDQVQQIVVSLKR